MHRFYAFHAFTMFHRNTIAAAAFFLAAKVRKQHMTHRHHRLCITMKLIYLGRRTAPKVGACYQNSQYLSRKDGHESRHVCGAGTGACSQ